MSIGVLLYWTVVPLSTPLITSQTGVGADLRENMGARAMTKNIDLDERPVGWILRPAAKVLKINRGTFSYDAIGLTINGILMTLPFSILFWSTGHVLAGFIALAAGASKTLAYLIGWETPLRRYGATEVGEYLTGAFQWGLFGIIFIMLTA